MSTTQRKLGSRAAPKYEGFREEELKNKVAADYFNDYDNTQIIGNIDFCVAPRNKRAGDVMLFDDMNHPPLLWAEAKKGVLSDINESFVQLILTIGKARVFDNHLPPNFLGAFDAEKIAFIPYHTIQNVFTQNDFNWNVAPSNHGTKEFLQLYKTTQEVLDKSKLVFNFIERSEDLKLFIKNNFKTGIQTLAKIKVNKNNFTFVYQKWCKEVMPSISVDWAKVKRAGLLDADFFFADLLSKENKTLKDKLFVLLQDNRYIVDRHIDETGFETSKQATFKDNQKAHNLFWNLYERPPKKEYWEYIIERRDLLVPQDVRERRGSFFTPQVWVELSQRYIADVLGDDWQDEYYVWDCCAGTGNLLNGLTNKRHIFASTLDKADVNVILDRISNGAALFENHVFQFDFLNDDFIPVSQGGKLPDKLHAIISDEERRKKLVIYINPPYAEASNGRTSSGTGKNRKGLSESNVRDKYKDKYGRAINELFSQFFIRIYEEIQCCKLAQFATLKALSAPNFANFRSSFKAEIKKAFLVPADTFDNVRGKFPIGFVVWDLGQKEEFKETVADVYNAQGFFLQTKRIFAVSDKMVINKWLHAHFDLSCEKVGWLRFVPNDFQNNGGVYIVLQPTESDIRESRITPITKMNFLVVSVYVAVRHCIESTWLNDRDQFLYPNDRWKEDKEFQSDCLVYTLFHGQNRITSAQGTNHWIPFTEEQVGITTSFESHFTSDLLNGKVKIYNDDLGFETKQTEKITFSPAASAVYDSGLQLWQYYHTKHDTKINASFYDIREYFQGRNSRGKMNSDSNDEYYTELIRTLRDNMKLLARKIEPKVYEHGFLR